MQLVLNVMIDEIQVFQPACLYPYCRQRTKHTGDKPGQTRGEYASWLPQTSTQIVLNLSTPKG